MPKRFNKAALRVDIIEGKFSDLFIELTKIVLNLPEFVNDDELKHTINISHISNITTHWVFLETRARNDDHGYSDQLIFIACELENDEIVIKERLGELVDGHFLPAEFISSLKNTLGGYLFDHQD
jgi:hypothetical protein